MTTFTTEDIESLKTEWFPATINPVHEGLYEINMETWPWPAMVEWSNEHGWFVDKGVVVTTWRGLKVKVE